MQNSAFFNSKNGDRVYKAEDFAEYFASFIGNGVFPNPSSGLQVQEGLDMKIVIRAGKAWINGYIYHNRGDYIITLDNADGILTRIDRVVARWSAVDREITLAVKKGSLSANPTAPELQRDNDVYELALADIAVNGGAVAVTQADITDLRLNKKLCGIVKGTIEEIDTTTIFNQFQSYFDTFTSEETKKIKEWLQSVKDILDENTALKLMNLIEAKQERITVEGLLKGDGEGGVTLAEPGIDYPTVESVNGAIDTANTALEKAGTGGGGIIVPGIVFGNLAFYVNDSEGNDDNDGITATTPWKTIKRLLEELNRNHTYFGEVKIFITKGEYDDHFLLNDKYFKLLRLEGTTTPTAEVYMQRVKLTNITGCVELNTVSAYTINCEKIPFLTVNKCVLAGFRSTGVLAYNCNSVYVSGSSFSARSTGIRAEHNTILSSFSNTGTNNDQGLWALNAIIFKSGSQPTGGTAEHKSVGGQIFG